MATTADKNTAPKARKDIHRSWTTKDVFVATALAFFSAQAFISVVAALFSAIFGADAVFSAIDESPWIGLTLTGVNAAMMLAVIAWYMKRLQYKIVDLGFRRHWSWMISARVLGTYIVYLFIAGILTQIVSSLFPAFNPEEAQQIGFAGAQGWQLLLAFVGLVVIPPIAEEFVFRGYVYKGLKERWNGKVALLWGLGIAALVALFLGAVAGLVLVALFALAYYIGKTKPMIAAAVVTSALFGLVHLQWNIAVDTFIFSFALIYILEKTKNLWASVALHALKNGVAFIAIFVLGQ